MGRFLAKACVFAVSLAALLRGFEVLVTSMTPWQRYEDPHARILWDGAFDGSRIVLLGASEFASIYVDSMSNALWARIEAYTGQRVFPAALNGARALDIVAAAVHISREWPRGTRVLISLAPTRFVESRRGEPPGGNYADTYFRRYGIDAADDGVWRRVQGQTYRWLLGPFFAARTRSALAHLVDRPGQPRWMRHRVWFREQSGVPKERFELFERNLVMGAPPRALDSVLTVKHRLEAAGMRPVFVLTPLNEPLVRDFAQVHSPDAILHHLRGTVTAVRRQLEATGAAVIDITDGIPSECFLDLVHVNTCGDDLMAARLADWLNQHPDDGP